MRDDNTEQKDRTLLRPLERGLRTLAFLADQPASLSEIARAIDAPKSSLISVLQTLVTLGYADHDGKLYKVGRQATTLAARLMGNSSVFYAALPALEALAVASGENVALARFDVDAQKLVYTHKVEGTHRIRLNIEIGAQRNLYSSNGGRVILAHQPDEWIESYFRETELKAYTTHTVADPKLLWEEVRKIREPRHFFSSISKSRSWVSNTKSISRSRYVVSIIINPA